jgi:conjugative transfer pilus assembly protein TraH
MNNLQHIMQTLNGVMKNSCEAGKAIVDATAGPELKEWGKFIGDETASSVNTAKGVTNDWFTNLNDALTPSQKLTQSGNASAVSVNVGKKAMDNANITAWYAHGDDRLAMVLLSLTGSLIVGPNKDNSDIVFSSPPAIISVKDFIEGGNVTIYQCPDADCLALDPKVNVQQYQMVGMRALVREMLFGTCACNAGSGGIVRKMANRGDKTTFTAREQAFIESSNPGVLGLINRIGTDYQAAALVADKMVNIVAVEMAHSIAKEMFGSVKAALKATGSDVPMTNTLVDNIEKVEHGIDEERKAAAESIAGLGTLIDMYKNVRENLNSKSSLATGLN